jgi:hypothetical protein
MRANAAQKKEMEHLLRPVLVVRRVRTVANAWNRVPPAHARKHEASAIQGARPHTGAVTMGQVTC